MVGQTQECERAWVGDFDYPTGHSILRHFPAKISNSILMIFLSSVVARWGPKSAQIEKCEVETLLVGPFHIGFKGKKWVLGVFSMSHPNRSVMTWEKKLFGTCGFAGPDRNRCLRARMCGCRQVALSSPVPSGRSTHTCWASAAQGTQSAMLAHFFL